MGWIKTHSAPLQILAGALCLLAVATAQVVNPNPAPAAQQPGTSAPIKPSSKSTAKHRRHKVKIAKQVQADPPPPPAPLPPPEPPKPEQMPAILPIVSYQNGQLTITAPNSTLSDILRAVKGKTGANIEIPPGSNERVVGKMGPGAPRDILAALFTTASGRM